MDNNQHKTSILWKINSRIYTVGDTVSDAEAAFKNHYEDSDIDTIKRVGTIVI